MVRSSFEDLFEYGWINKKNLIREVVKLVEYESDILKEMDDEFEIWKSFIQKISEESYDGKMRRYVGTIILKDEDIYESKIEELATESIENPDKLEESLQWLLSSEPKQHRVLKFGQAVGRKDQQNEFIDYILGTLLDLEDITPGFIAGYLKALHDRDPEKRQDILDSIQEQDTLRPLLVDIIRLSGITSNDTDRIIKALKDDDISPNVLFGLEMGGTSRNIEEPQFRELCKSLIDRGVEYVYSTLPVFYQYYVFPDEGPSLPANLAQDLLKHPAFIEEQDTLQSSQRIVHYWKEIATAFLKEYPDHRMNILELLLDIIKRGRSVICRSQELEEMLDYFWSNHPEETWLKISDTLLNYSDTVYFLSDWLSGRTIQSNWIPIKKLQVSLVWEWIDEDIETRAPIAAKFVPAEFFHDESEICLARQVLIRYGDGEKVQEEMSNTYFLGFRMGSESEHYKQKKDRLELFLQREEDSTVISWIESEIDKLEEAIKKAERKEEKLGLK